MWTKLHSDVREKEIDIQKSEIKSLTYFIVFLKIDVYMHPSEMNTKNPEPQLTFVSKSVQCQCSQRRRWRHLNGKGNQLRKTQGNINSVWQRRS